MEIFPKNERSVKREERYFKQQGYRIFQEGRKCGYFLGESLFLF